MKKRSEIQDILLKMHYDPKKTLNENSELVFGKSTILEQSETIVSSNDEGFTPYEGIGGTVWFNNLDLEGVTSITRRNNWTDIFPSWVERADCEQSILWNKQTKAQQEKKLGDFFNPHEGKLFSFTVSGEKYYAMPMMGCEAGDLKYGGYRKKPYSRDDIYVSPKLPKSLQDKIDAETTTVSSQIINLSETKNMDNPDSFADMLYELREILASTTFQIFAAALSIAVAAVAGPWAIFFSRLLDWGIDIIVLVADAIAAFRFPENDLHWQHVGEDFVNLGLGAGIMGIFKGAKNLKQALGKKEGMKFMKEIKDWILGKLDIFIGWTKGTKLGSSLTNFKEWLEELIGKTAGTIVSTFITVGLPLAGFTMAAFRLADPVLQPLGNIISKVLNIPLSELQNWAIGDKIPEQYIAQAEQINHQMKNDTVTVLTKIEMDNSEIIKSAENQVEATGEIIKNSVSKIEEESVQLIQTNNKQYCTDVISYMEGPCKDFLQKKLDENKLEFIISGEKGTVMLIDGKEGYAILTDFDPDKLVDKNSIDVDCTTI